jgi:hypothetical protein
MSMSRVEVMYVFFTISGGKEQIMTGVDDDGKMIPLVYLHRDNLQYEKMVPFVKKYAEQTGVYVELREYALIEKSIEKFYPDKTQYNA